VGLLFSYTLNPREVGPARTLNSKGVGFNLRADPKNGSAGTRHSPTWSQARTCIGPR
jgi:hypothetical protein